MEEYLKVLLEQIRCKKAWPYIRQELQDHIEDQIEANIEAGMDWESAEKAAVRDMGDPVETGISLDRIHKPQIAWRLLALIALVSGIGIFIHGRIGANVSEGAASSGSYALHVLAGIALMMLLYFVDYTLLARFSRLAAVLLAGLCLWTVCFGNMVNGAKFLTIFGGMTISVRSWMMFYVPVYGGILYHYRGDAYKGLLKAVGWMLLPLVFLWRLPSLATASLLFVSMLVMLTMAVWQGWFAVQRKRVIGGLWGLFVAFPAAACLTLYLGGTLPGYQMQRIQAVLSPGGEGLAILRKSALMGDSGANLTEMLPDFYADYLLIYLSSVYGILAAIFISCVLAVLIVSVFGVAIRQKNQLGRMMGCGCGMVFLGSFLKNILVNMGWLPQTATFLPFLSAGGSNLIVSYGLMGIVLSIYRYKNIYPKDGKGMMAGKKRQMLE